MEGQLEELSALKGGVIPDFFLILPLVSQILYKEGMKCTQEKARNRPKMKEVVNHLPPRKLDFFSAPGVRGIAEVREPLSNSL